LFPEPASLKTAVFSVFPRTPALFCPPPGKNYFYVGLYLSNHSCYTGGVKIIKSLPVAGAAPNGGAAAERGRPAGAD
jgi:hypothetical protein